MMFYERFQRDMISMPHQIKGSSSLMKNQWFSRYLFEEHGYVSEWGIS
jgi:hypothetical protein